MVCLSCREFSEDYNLWPAILGSIPQAQPRTKGYCLNLWKRIGHTTIGHFLIRLVSDRMRSLSPIVIFCFGFRHKFVRFQHLRLYSWRPESRCELRLVLANMAIPESGKSNGVCGLVNSVAIYYEKGANGNAFLRKEKFRAQGAHFSKVPRTLRARKAIRKTTTCLFCKADLFTCCKGNKNKNNGKVSCLETPSFWRYKENYVTRNTPEKFRDFREIGPSFLGRWGRSKI